ncbi:hypothetical protein HDU98_001239 [Podochytrium sp. JEL0797]|nr:hypothetical protein HDU98_001239 [Podochytrium sp. JEL0797]
MFPFWKKKSTQPGDSSRRGSPAPSLMAGRSASTQPGPATRGMSYDGYDRAPRAPPANDTPYVSRLDPLAGRTLSDESFLDEMLGSLDKITSAPASTAASAPLPPPKQNKYPALRPASLPAPSRQPPSVSYLRVEPILENTTAPKSMEDDILAAFDMLKVLDSPNLDLNSQSRESPLRTQSTPDTGLSTNAYIPPTANTRSNAYTPNTPLSPLSSTTPAKTTSLNNFAKAYNLASRSSNNGNWRTNSTPISTTPATPSKFNRNQRATSALAQVIDPALQNKRDQDEQEKTRRIEAAKAIYFQEQQEKGFAPPLSTIPQQQRSPSRSSQRSLFGMRSGSMSSMRMGKKKKDTDSIMTRDDDDEDNRALGTILPNAIRPSSMMEKRSMTQQTMNTINITNWLKGTTSSTRSRSGSPTPSFQQLSPPSSPTGPLPPGQGLTKTRSLSNVFTKMRSASPSRQPASPVPAPPPISRSTSNFTPPSIYTNQQQQPQRIKSPLTPLKKQNTPSMKSTSSLPPPPSPTTPSGVANPSTLQHLYHSQAVKKMNESHTQQQQQQNAMMTYLAQMAGVMQAQQQMIIQQQNTPPQPIVVAMAPAGTGLPAGMLVGAAPAAVGAGGSEEGKEKRKKKKKSRVLSDGGNEGMEILSTGSSGSSGGAESDRVEGVPAGQEVGGVSSGVEEKYVMVPGVAGGVETIVA